MKEISVIVPVYNVERYLEKCLESIANQTFKSYEVIMVDDGSSDGSRDIAQKFVKLDEEKFKLICQENKGLSGARNTGLEYSNGKYICFVDSDDYIECNYLEVLYEPVLKQDVDMTFCAFRSVDEENNCLETIFETKIKPQKTYNIYNTKELFLIQNAVWNKLYKKEIIEKNNIMFTEGVWYEDLRFTKKYLLFAEKCVYCEEVLYNYLQRIGSIMHSINSERNIEILDAIDEVEVFLDQNGVKEQFRKEIEILAIEHVYISAMVRMIRANNRISVNLLREEFLKRYPNHYKNKYIRTLGKNRLVVYFLINFKLYGLVKKFFEIKGEKNV